ncbi:MAG: hypothetical protein AAGA58_13690 [Verrucomicrobiota bacterium]
MGSPAKTSSLTGLVQPDSADDLLKLLLRDRVGASNLSSAVESGILDDLREEFARNELAGADLLSLWRMLSLVVAKSAFSALTSERLHLLNLACAHCEEAPLLRAFFGQFGPPVRLYGVDIRDREIDTARRRYELTEKVFSKLGVPRLRSESAEDEAVFLADDARNLVGYGQIPGEFHVIFLRHQNLWHDREIWQRIFEFALSRLKPDGLLVITSYFDREHLLATQLLQILGAELAFTARNPDSRELDYPGKSIDRHVAAFRRREFVSAAGISVE